MRKDAEPFLTIEGAADMTLSRRVLAAINIADADVAFRTIVDFDLNSTC